MSTKTGSALVMVILITAVLMIATTSSWYISSLLHDTALVRQQTAQRMQAVEGLLVYADAKVADNFDLYYQIESPELVYQGSWPCGDSGSYVGRVISCTKEKGIVVRAELYKDDQVVAALSSVLERDATSSIIIARWSMYELTS